MFLIILINGNFRDQLTFTIVSYINFYLVNGRVITVTTFVIVYLRHLIMIGLINIFLIIRDFKFTLTFIIIRNLLILTITLLILIITLLILIIVLQYKAELWCSFIRKRTTSQQFLNRKSNTSFRCILIDKGQIVSVGTILIGTVYHFYFLGYSKSAVPFILHIYCNFIKPITVVIVIKIAFYLFNVIDKVFSCGYIYITNCISSLIFYCKRILIIR